MKNLHCMYSILIARPNLNYYLQARNALTCKAILDKVQENEITAGKSKKKYTFLNM